MHIHASSLYLQFSALPQLHIFHFPFLELQSNLPFVSPLSFHLASVFLHSSSPAPRSPAPLLCGLNSRSCRNAWDQLCKCVTASCRRDWRWLGPLRPHCSSWQGRSWELFNSRRIGGSASHHHPPALPYTHTQTNTHMHLCIPRHSTAWTALCVCPDKASLLPESTLRLWKVL